MQIYTLSDLHLEAGTINDRVEQALKDLCRYIRTYPYGGRKILFILLGDIINQGHKEAFDNARHCLEGLCNQLHDYEVQFEMVPGNHDRSEGDISAFDSFANEFDVPITFETTKAYSKQYEDINFIFADTTWGGKHDEPGHLDLDAVQRELKTGIENVLVFHHALTHYHIDCHDCIWEGDRLAVELRKIGIKYVIHGHTHQADMSTSKETVNEFGCGSLLQPMDGMPYGTNNQFARIDCRDGKIIAIERILFTADGNGYAYSQLYPEERHFVDPEKIGKLTYPSTGNLHIERRVFPNTTASEDAIARLLSDTTERTLMDALLDNKHILLLSDAGCGKSNELKELAYTAGQCFYFPFLFQLKYYVSEEIDELLPEGYRELHPERLILLFDGYDELTESNRISFFQSLYRYADRKTKVKIVITSRSNFCSAEFENESRTFPSFYVFRFAELSRQDQATYLQKREISPSEFFDAAERSGVMNLLETPFYLHGLADIFSHDKELPSRAKLMDRMIQLRFRRDEEKFIGRLGEREYQLFSNLQKLSFSMQLMHRQELVNGSEYQRLFSPEERELMNESGLLERHGDKLQFTHNNFREYLAAKELDSYPLDTQLSFIQQDGTIYPKWVNTLGYLCGLDEKGELLSWLTENAPDVLVKLERDRVDAETRNRVFQDLFSYYESRGLWFNSDLCSERELVQFATSKVTLLYLLDKIAHPVHHVSRCTALRMLAETPTLYRMQDEVRRVLLDCCQENVQDDNSVFELSLRALWRLNLQTDAATEQIVSISHNSELSAIRYSLYKYLLKSDRQDAYFGVFIEGVRFLQRAKRRSEHRRTDEEIILGDGLKKMTQVESIIAALHALVDDRSNRFYAKDAIIQTLFHSAAELYNAGKMELFPDIVAICFRGETNGEYAALKGGLEFFHSTQTEKQAVIKLTEICEQKREFGLIIAQDDGLIGSAMALYADGELSDEAFLLLMDFCRDEMYYKCRQVILDKTGIELPVRVHCQSYEELRKQRDHEYFSILFDRQAAERMLGELLSCVGDEDATVDSIQQAWSKVDSSLPLIYLLHALYRYAPGESKARDFFKTVDWDTFVICEAFHRLQQTGEKPSEEHTIALTELLKRTISIDFVANALKYYEENHGLAPETCYTLQLAVLLGIHLQEDSLLALTLLPNYYLSLDYEEHPYSYLKEQLGISTLKEKVIQDLEEDAVTGDALTEHVQFCREIHCAAAERYAIDICQSSDYTQHAKHQSFKYLYDLRGVDFIIEEVLPWLDGEFLCMIAGNYKDFPVATLRNAMELRYRETQDSNLQKYLISYGSRLALEQYTNEVLKTHKLPEDKTEYADGPTSAINTISDPALLPFLGQLLEITCYPDFTDAEFGGLQSGIISAFLHCGEMDSDAAMCELLKHEAVTATSDKNKSTYEYIKEAIMKQQKAKKDVIYSIEQVEEYWRNIKRRTSV